MSMSPIVGSSGKRVRERERLGESDGKVDADDDGESINKPSLARVAHFERGIVSRGGGSCLPFVSFVTHTTTRVGWSTE